MLQSRIREIRKEKGLTLQEVADRAGTTAQTIGRLETGLRTLSIKWVERIATALGTDPGELLSLPEGGDVEITGAAGADGNITEKALGIVALRLSAQRPVAIKLKDNLSQYQRGDHIICDQIPKDKLDEAYGRDCIVRTKGGELKFTKILRGRKAGTVTLVPIAATGEVIEDCTVEMIAPTVTLIRQLGTN